MKTILVTGSAGFIGANLVLRLLESQEPTKIVGLDNLNNYYDPSLKEYISPFVDGSQMPASSRQSLSLYNNKESARGSVNSASGCII